MQDLIQIIIYNLIDIWQRPFVNYYEFQLSTRPNSLDTKGIEHQDTLRQFLYNETENCIQFIFFLLMWRFLTRDTYL